MRIGEFAQANLTSIDTIRHYMDLGLIVPERQGTYFYFDDRCKRDYERIVEMKDMGFSLTEIRNMLLIIRFSKMASGMEIEHYRNFFQNKCEELIDKRGQIDAQIDQLQDRIELLKQARTEKKHVIGWNLEFLSLLSCPMCHSTLNLAQASIENNAIKAGVLTCECSHSLYFEEGILVDPVSMKKNVEPDEAYFIRYIRQNSDRYLDNIYKAMEWGYRNIDVSSVENKNVMELGVGNGIFLSHIIKALPESTRYLAIDYDLNRLKYLKKMLERVEYKAQVVFICSDFKYLPLKEQQISYVIDFYGSAGFHMSETVFLHSHLDRLYAKNCGLMGIFMCFDSFKKTSKVPEASQDFFKRESLMKRIDALGFKPQIQTMIGDEEEQDKHDAYYEITNRIVNYGFCGSRKEKKKY